MFCYQKRSSAETKIEQEWVTMMLGRHHLGCIDCLDFLLSLPCWRIVSWPDLISSSNVQRTVKRMLTPINMQSVMLWGGVGGVTALWMVQPFDYIRDLMSSSGEESK